jgi:hypothetical protein
MPKKVQYPELPDYYLVKYTVAGKKSYGVVERFYDGSASKEEKAIRSRNNFLIADAVYLKSYEVNPARVKPVEYEEFNKAVEKARKAAQKISDSLPDGVHPGSLFRIPVADGYAHYTVTEVNKSICTVEWRGFGGGDRYTDHWFGWGGTYKTKDVATYVARDRAWDRILSKAMKRKTKAPTV